MLPRQALVATALGTALIAPLGDNTLSGSAGPVEPATRVILISVDGLNPAALRELGRDGTPHIHRLMAEGAATLNARTQVEMTTTLPNHTSLATGRRIERKRQGHGVTWNSHIPGSTVQKAAGHAVASIFSLLHKAGMNTALFAAKSKFSLFDRSWPGIDRVTIKDEKDLALTKAVRSDLVAHSRAFTFLHLGGVDKTGHADGFMSAGYLTAVRRVDAKIGMLLKTIRAHPRLDDLTVVLTADHGGRGNGHSDQRKPANYRVPFIVWGPDVTHDDLYDLNPTYQSPGRRRVGFSGEQPIRNGDAANFVADLLGLGPVPNSLWNAEQELRVN